MIASTFVVAVLFTIIAIIAVVFAVVQLPLRLLGKAKTAQKENGKR